VDFVQGDIRDAAKLKQAMAGVDVVVHAAAHVHVGWSNSDLHQQINVEGTKLVATAALEAGAKLIHVSTINTLGIGLLSNPANEDSGLPGLTVCPYVTSKTRAEQAVLEQIERGLRGVIVHPSFCLGPWDWKPSSGSMLLAVGQGALYWPVGAFSIGDVRDVSAGIAAAAKLAPPGRRYILGGHNMSYRDAWRVFARVGGSHEPRMRAGPIARCVASWGSDAWARLTGGEGGLNSAAIRIAAQQTCFSSERAMSELGYRLRPLEETVADAWNWFCERGYVGKKGLTSGPAVKIQS
jgi:dihydroflavonol-4-reductase